MAKKNKTYKKLPGFALNLFSAPSLWQGMDHLLSVEAVLFQERYKRFYYKDIQAVVMNRTKRHHVWSAIWGGLALVFALIVIFSTGAAYVSSGFMALFGALLIVNFMMGPACRVHIQTAVQIQHLRSLKRMKSAAKAMHRIKLLVEAAQGKLDREAMAATAAFAAASPQVGNAPGTVSAVQSRPDEIRGEFSPLPHRILFALLLTLGTLGLVQFGLKSLPISILETLLHATAQIMVIVAVVRGFRYLKGTWLAKLSWLSLGTIILVSLVSYVLFFIVSARHPEIAYNNWELYKVGFKMISSNTPVMLTMNLFFTAGYLLLGILGFFALGRFAQNQARTVGP
jgi:hypothetical protein